MDQLTKCTFRLSMAVAVALIASCAGPEGPAGAAGANGANGATGATGTTGAMGIPGAPCTVSNYDGGVTVTCPGSAPVNVPNGTNGQSCTVTNIDGGVSVACPGSSPVTVLNGTNATTSNKPMVEQCLVCHGPGAIAPITLMHNGRVRNDPQHREGQASEVAGLAAARIHRKKLSSDEMRERGVR